MSLVAAGPARVSLLRYSPALVLFAIVVADARQLNDPDLWGHVLWGRELLAHGSLPRVNPYSYSAPGFPWLHHEWLSEVLMASMFDKFGPLGLKLLKFLCTAGTICFIVLAESETAVPAFVQAAILLVVALILLPAMQFRPQLFDFVALSAIIALLARHNWRGSARLWIAIPIVAVWSNFHGGFFIGLVAMGVYGAATLLSDILARRGPRRGLGIIAITAAAAASTLCTLLIPPARDTWHTLIHSILNPMTHYAIVDWIPLIAALRTAPGGSIQQKYFVLAILFFAAAVVSVVLTPKRADAPLVAVAAVMLAAAFSAVRNIPIAAIAIAPVIANHLGLLRRPREVTVPRPVSARAMPRAGRLVIEILIAVVAIGFARSSGVLSPGIDASGYPVRAVEFMKNHGLEGNLLTQFAWGQYVIWHDAPGMKVFIDSRYDLAYPPAVVQDYLEFASNVAGGAHTLAAYPHDFVLIERGSPAVKLMDSQRDWRLIYSDDTARLYARANSPAARLEGVPIAGASGPSMFP
ncbi:MAG: hypothetical protein ABSB13_09850 [Candidatus Binatus sp.]|jgi:hypothetical protein|uniref:hypothetical protein n=1 Tax=Candidatus Binatus sp. TaxID=2811406 RepID=UPI003D0F17A9